MAHPVGQAAAGTARAADRHRRRAALLRAGAGETIAAQSVAFVCEQLPFSGPAATAWAARRTEALRRGGPLLGVVFMVEDRRTGPPHAGPAGPHPGPGDTGLPCFVDELRRVRHEYHWELRNRRPAAPPVGGAVAPPARRRDAVPKSNVKHPSMLLLYALLPARPGREVYCEISPQEALLFVADSAGRGGGGRRGGLPVAAAGRGPAQHRRRAPATAAPGPRGRLRGDPGRL